MTALLISLLCATVAPQGPPRAKALAENLLPNPSFEEVAAEGARGWSSRAWDGRGDTRWTIESPGRTGERCVSIGSAKGADAAWTTTVTVKRHAWYRLSGWIKTQAVRGAVGALLNIQNMQTVRTQAVSGTQDWTLVSTVFRAEATELQSTMATGPPAGPPDPRAVALRAAFRSAVPLHSRACAAVSDPLAAATPRERWRDAERATRRSRHARRAGSGSVR